MPWREFLQTFLKRFNGERTTTLAASLAFYTVLSLAPLLIIFITISTRLDADLQRGLLTQVQAIAGPDAASTFQMILINARERPDLASLSGLFGALTLLLSASLIFGELQRDLNQIFGIPPLASKQNSWLKMAFYFLESKLLHIVFALGFILLMIVSIAASSMIFASLKTHLETIRLVNIFVSFLFFLVLFTLLYRYVPERPIAWGRSLQGGLLTALLFVIGKEAIGLYLGRSAVGSAYGAAGSLIILLVWVYYSALITFIGAHVSSLLLWKDHLHETDFAL